jgi:hypothetical protein
MTEEWIRIMSAPKQKTERMPIEERAKLYLASVSKYGSKRSAKSFRKLGEMEQCKIAGDVIGTMLSPDNSGHYYLQCPGIQFHGNKSGRRDCRFTPGDNGSSPRTAAPSLKCLHQSCGAIIEEMNRKIRSECGKASVEYMTDHGSSLNNAAAALIIGFDLADHRALDMLSAWNKTCNPIRTPLEVSRAIAAAIEARFKTPAEVGYLLKRARLASPASPSTPPTFSAESYESAANLGKRNVIDVPELPNEPIYLGARGRIAKAVKDKIQAMADDGYVPSVVLLGPDEPANITGKICGLPIQRGKIDGIHVYGGPSYALDG